MLQIGIEVLLTFCSSAFREKGHTADWHSDAVDLLQCGIQRERLYCRLAFWQHGIQSEKPHYVSWAFVEALSTFCSVAFREEGCAAGRHSGTAKSTAQEGPAGVQAECPPLHYPADCPAAKPTQRTWQQNPHPQTATH